MVHKCSEYRLQFRQLTNNVRADIWKENVNFRELLKRKNLSDHYWRYQLMEEECECDDVLINKTHGHTSPIVLNSSLNQPHLEYSSVADQAVQTPNWTVSNNDKDSRSASRLEEIETTQLKSVSPSMEVPLEQTKEPPVNMLPAATETSSLPNPKVAVLTDGREESKNTPQLFKPKLHYNKPEYWKDDTPITHLNPCPTRDALRFHKKDKKPVFVAFGWNDSNKDVGDKKTHNVLAPFDQVKEPALQALRNRQRDLEKYFASQRGWRKNQQSLISLGPVDCTTWVTEYQEKFCREPRDFIYNPNKINSHRRPVVWRHS